MPGSGELVVGWGEVEMLEIAAILPEALFIVIHRDLADNGHSLLEGRIRVHGSVEQWWSAEPADVEDLRTLPPHQQVVEQIRSMDREVAGVEAAVGSSRFMHVSYERLCDEPLAVLTEIERFCTAQGVPLRSRDVSLPSSFPRRAKVRIDPDLYQAMCRYIEDVAESAPTGSRA